MGYRWSAWIEEYFIYKVVREGLFEKVILEPSPEWWEGATLATEGKTGEEKGNQADS